MDNGDLLLNAALAAESGPEVDRISETVIAIGENHPNPQEAIRAYLASKGADQG